jgi:hypothetical protein
MSAAETVEIEDEDDFEFVIEDDTPEEDRGRSKATDNDLDDDSEPDDEELKNYSAGAAKRIKVLTKKRHDERRAKEATERELQVAVGEIQKLRTYLSGATKAIVTKDKASLGSELDAAKKELTEAIELGDGAKVADATVKVTEIKNKISRVEVAEREIDSQPAPRDEGDPADQSKWPQSRKDWYSKNQDWFHKDEEMTGYVYGLHQKLIKKGVAPDSEEYYEQIDSKMQKMFPEHFGNDNDDDEEEVEERPAPRKAEQRTTALNGSGGAKTKNGKKVYRITKSEAALCARLGISHKDYIEEKLKMEGN